MQDLFEHQVICKNCKKETSKTKTLKDGFELRAWECQKCNTVIYHPGDFKEYEDYKKLRKQNFDVKLRMVGNSFCVSIPKEIIDFHQEMLEAFAEEQKHMEKKINQLVRLSLEEPGKIGLFFFKKNRHSRSLFENESGDEEAEEDEESEDDPEDYRGMRRY